MSNVYSFYIFFVLLSLKTYVTALHEIVLGLKKQLGDSFG